MSSILSYIWKDVRYDEQPLPAGKPGHSTHVQNAVSDVAAKGLDKHIAEKEDGKTFGSLIPRIV